MMRKLFLLATATFWNAVLVAWAGTRWPPPAVPQAAVAGQRLMLADVARHADPADCWMAIGGGVYDLTAYLPEHPSKSGIIEPWCGKEATQAYQTKMKGRSHSPEADHLLSQYRVGTLDEP